MPVSGLRLFFSQLHSMSQHPAFTHTILQWFAENGRALPWRETHNPYAIWLSEIILQQTRINQGREYWERFMRQYPTVESLAAASEDDVLKLWQGLGYYSRARNLHTAARQIVELGRFPDTLEGIKRLKGVGDYTAAAIGSIAFGLPAAVVDGNVYRVLARYFGISTPINTTRGKKEFAALAQSLLPEKEASAYNQGMMDFGALQCTPQSPRCLLCPLSAGCAALATGQVELLPVKEKTVKVRTRHLTYVYIRCQGKVAIRRRGKGDIWQGLWEPFNTSLHEENANATPPEILGMLQMGGDQAVLTPVAMQVKHVLTHRILLADFYLLEAETRPVLPDEYEWIDEDRWEEYGVPRLIELLVERLHAK